jgi:hypothetical protein
MVVPKLGIGVIRQAFVEALGRSTVKEHLYLGTVADESGNLVPDLATFRGEHPARLRGNEQSTFRICKSCGRPRYYAMGKRYLLRDNFPHNPLFESSIHQLVIDQTILDRIDLKQWKKIYIEELPLVDAPSGGLPARLEEQKVDRAPEF